MTNEPPDSADVDAIAELKVSLGWTHVEERIRQELVRRQEELEQLCDPPLTNYIRGQIASLRTVLDIPAILEDEFKGQL